MNDWTKHDSSEPPALAPAALVIVRAEYPAWVFRADEVCWEPGLEYQHPRDEDGLPYISADGLEEWAEYVATDSDGLVGQFKARPWIECVLWVTGLVAREYSAPETHRHPGDWRESLYRVWRDE